MSKSLNLSKIITEYHCYNLIIILLPLLCFQFLEYFHQTSAGYVSTEIEFVYQPARTGT